MKKRLILLILALGLLCGCGGKEAAPAPEPEPVSRAQPQAQGAGDAAPPPPAEEEAAPAGSRDWAFAISRAAGDRSCAFLQVDVTAPEGVALDADSYQLDAMPLLEGPTGGGWGVELLEDGDRTDGRASFLIDLSMDGDIKNAQGVLLISGLEAIRWSGDHQSDRIIPLVTGSWELPFRLDYLEGSAAYALDRDVETAQGALKITGVEVSPLSVLIRHTGSAAMEPAIAGVAVHPGTVQVEVRDREGKAFPIGMSRNPARGTALLAFRDPIDPEAVVSLVLDGAEIPLAG